MSSPGSWGDGECPVRDFPPLFPQSAEQITVLCGFNDTQATGMEGPQESPDPPLRPLARHLSDADRLRKVIQELLDTEKSYVKVMEEAAPPPCAPCLLRPALYWPGPLPTPSQDPPPGGPCPPHDGANCRWGGRAGGRAARAGKN